MVVNTSDYVIMYMSCNEEIEKVCHLEEELKTKGEQYVKIEVRNPRTHISREKALYTDYEILIETNNITFASSESCVRRRYSDFQWLRNRLLSQYGIEKHLPELPPKRLFGRFKRPFLKHRQRGLQRFLEDITNETAYLSDITLHLFLQSSLSVKEIDSKLNGTDSGGELIEALQSPVTSRGRGLSRSSSHVDSTLDLPLVTQELNNFEHDSGFSYSTTSSLNDGMTAHVPLHKPIPSNHYFAPSFDYNRDHKHQVKKHLNFTDTQHHYYTYQQPLQHDTTTKQQQQEIEQQQIENLLNKSDNHSLATDSLPSLLLSTSDDDDLYPNNLNQYDADDEELDLDTFDKQQERNNNYFTHEDSDDEDDLLFCFCKDNQGTVYSLDRALEIISDRPKLTERLYLQEDSDDCFHESEYDVIDTEDDFDIDDIVDDETYPKATSLPSIRIRSSSYSYENHHFGDDFQNCNSNDQIDVGTPIVNLNIYTRSKNKLKTGKVKSLPNIRFPIRNKKLCKNNSSSNLKRSVTYHGRTDFKSEKLREIKENDEPQQVIDEKSKSIDCIYLQPCQRPISESENHILTSETDYLQTIHRYSQDSHDTNMDTQAEDKPPSKFYDFFRRKKKTKQANVKLLQFRKMNSVEGSSETTGRFHVSHVEESPNSTANNQFIKHNNNDVDSDNINNKQINNCSSMFPCGGQKMHDINDTDILKSTPHANGYTNLSIEHRNGNHALNAKSNPPQQINNTQCSKMPKDQLTTATMVDNHNCNHVANLSVLELCLHDDCQYSESYQMSSEEKQVREEITPEIKHSDIRKRTDSLLKTYDIITV